jgi:1-acyl-sn-glycerol-3-phosphate acyltransferase
MALEQQLSLVTRKTLTYRGVSRLIKILSAVLFRPSVTGREHIPTTGPVLIAPIHRSNIDFVFTLFLSKRKFFFMAKHSLFKIPGLSTLFMALGAFPVVRGTADRDSMALAESVLRQGLPLVLFPEGTRKEGFHVDPLHDGAAFVAARTGATIVPVGIAGTDKAMPRGAKMFRPAKVRVVVGPPIQPPSNDGRVPRSVITAKSEEIRVALEAAYHEALAGL